jgi:alkylation response protein AidB-like acyl-CoA dehydrogenase
MDFAIEDSAEQSAFREEVRRWLAENIPEGTEYPVDPGDLTLEQYQLRRELGRRLGACGWLYPNMPTQYGGGDLPIERVVILIEELSAAGLSIPPYYDAGGRMAAPTILVWGSEEHKDRFLPEI